MRTGHLFPFFEEIAESSRPKILRRDLFEGTVHSRVPDGDEDHQGK